MRRARRGLLAHACCAPDVGLTTQVIILRQCDVLSAELVSTSETWRHLGVWKVMWEMQQLGRRAGALDIDLISSRHRGDVYRLLTRGLMRENMENVRGPSRVG